MPPGWLLVVSVVVYLVFIPFKLIAGEVVEEAPDVDQDPDVNELVSFFNEIWEWITFDISELGLDGPLFFVIRGVLFTVLTLPWFFVIATGVIEGVKAIGSLLPFT